ncbi:complement factor B-like [Pelobates fuscus]|uniref:complement factor B-like n=1 Tax=Pelobates fuscus TaxID=191477 RepID=UPI002FE453E1
MRIPAFISVLKMWYLLLLSQVFVGISIPTPQCDLSQVSISGGSYVLITEENSIKYTCPKGMYPDPMPIRRCQFDGHWTKENIPAVCKAVRCPRPKILEDGDYFPSKSEYYVGDVLNFECYSGFELRGPENRTCQQNGKWSGRTTVCEDYGGFCPNPGIPIGTTKMGISYNVFNKVTYECEKGLKMFGSSERICMEDKYWSGAEPSCREWYTYDTPEEVAEMFSSSFSANIESANRDKLGEDYTPRKIHIKKGDPMNIFLLLDASKSVGETNFEIAKESSQIFIEKVSSFDIEPRYAIISFASLAISIVRLSDEESLEADAVIEKLSDFTYREHEDKRGTNTRAALHAVNEMLSLQHLRNKENFLDIRNVILLMTDGKYNMGGDPKVELDSIRHFLDIGMKDNIREDFLDVYVFGLGDDISQTELNNLASKKPHEQHVFHLEDVSSMKKAFDHMLDETEAMDMCGLNKYHSNQPTELFPWITKIKITRPGAQEICKGSILTKNFILTAAHCFYIDERLDYIKVQLGDGRLVNVKNFYRHPLYDPDAKKDKNIPKNFDYDIAILEMEKKISYSSSVRPICIPCTKSSSWALRMKGDTTKCKDHKDFLFKEELVKAMFIAEEDPKPMEGMNVTIKLGNARESCLRATERIEKFQDIADIHDMVTDQFLCTGGTEPYVEPPTCKGDSGGPLIIEYKNRYIQVGVISWGSINHCKGPVRLKTPVPEDSRDFHISIFSMLPWIEEIVKEELIYLPN